MGHDFEPLSVRIIEAGIAVHKARAWLSGIQMQRIDARLKANHAALR
jgi:hypothetical protein